MKKLRFFSSITLFSAITLLAACGQKGPLYLPVKPAATSTTANPAPASAPASASAETKKTAE